MAQVGGVRIPFVVDTTDIPKSVKEVESQLRRLKKTAADTRIHIDGRYIGKLNAEHIAPLIRNLGVIREKSLRASVAIKEIGKATTSLRGGQIISDKLVNSLSQLSGVGPKTVRSIKEYNRLTKQLYDIDKAATAASRKMSILGKSVASLRARKPLTGGQEGQLQQFVGKKTLASVEKYRRAMLLLNQGMTERGGKEIQIGKAREVVLKRINKLRLKAIADLERESRQQRKTLATQEEQQASVNRQRERTIGLLKRAEGSNRRILDTTKQRMILEASPRVGYAKKLELRYARDLDRTYRELMVKRKKGIITDHERIRLARTMEKLMKRQGWESKNRLRIQKQLVAETQKQVVVEQRKRKSQFPGGGLLSPGRMGWFVQLRAFWGVYQMFQKAIMEMVELDEAIGRAMRTMSRETADYGKTAERVHNTVIQVARETGAAYRDIGEALYQLSSAGLSAEEALAAVNSVMRLTRTTEAEVTDATKVIAGVFNNFKDALGSVLNDTEAFALISGTLSYVWERNQVDMNEMVQALNQAAQVAKLAGVNFKELSIVVGNLGTMMIRSGRAGRSIRTAIIHMAAKGRQLADVFGYTFDPNQPIDFMRTMDKMHEQWKDVNKTALLTAKITTIFGRRGTPAILALLDSWEKVRKEIADAGDTLELVTKQQEKLLRLQERYKHITETVWKEIMANVAEYADVVSWIRSQLHELLTATRRGRAREETAAGPSGLLERYEDAGKLTERLGFALANLRIAQARQTEGLQKAIPAWKVWVSALLGADAAAFYLSRRKKDLDSIIQTWEDYVAELKKTLVMQTTIETLRKDRAQGEEAAKRRVVSEEEAWAELRAELNEHRALRGELVYSKEQLIKKIKDEKIQLRGLHQLWVDSFKTNSENKEVIDAITKKLLKQSDAVKKLTANLTKLYKLEVKETQKIFKNQLAFYDARISLQKEYTKSVEKWTGLREKLEAQEATNKLERLKTEKSQQEQLLLIAQQQRDALASFADEKTGEMPVEMRVDWDKVNRELDEIKRKLAELTKKEIVLDVKLDFAVRGDLEATKGKLVSEIEELKTKRVETLYKAEDLETEAKTLERREELSRANAVKVEAERLRAQYAIIERDLRLHQERLAKLQDIKEGASVRFQRPELVISEEEWEVQQRPAHLARQQELVERDQEHEMALYDIRTAYKEKYANYYSLWYSEEEMAERARLAAQRERLEIERQNLMEQRDLILARVQAIQAQIDAAPVGEDTSALEADKKALEVKYEGIGRSLEINAEQVKSVQQTKLEAANENIRALMREGDALAATTELWKTHKDTLTNYTGQMVEAWKNMFEQMGQKSKTAWDLYKALAIAQTIVSGIQLAWEGAKALAGIPYVGPALAIAWIATIAAQTAVQVKMIEQQKPAGYAEGGIATGDKKGYPVTLHGSEAIIPLADGKTIPVDVKEVGNKVQAQVTLSRGRSIPVDIQSKKEYAKGGVTSGKIIQTQKEQTKETTTEQISRVLNTLKQNEEVKNIVVDNITQNKTTENQIYNTVKESEAVKTRAYDSLQQNEEIKTKIKSVSDEQYNTIVETIQQQDDSKIKAYAVGGMTSGKIIQMHKDQSDDTINDQKDIVSDTLKTYVTLQKTEEAKTRAKSASFADGGVVSGKIIQLVKEQVESGSHEQEEILYDTLKQTEATKEKVKTSTYNQGGVTSGKIIQMHKDQTEDAPIVEDRLPQERRQQADVIQLVRDQVESASIGQKSVAYTDLVALDNEKAKATSYASGGVTRGATMALLGDNKSGREIILPEENIYDDRVGPAYRRDKEKEQQINVINLVTQEDVAAAMSTKLGGRVIVNQIGRDLQSRKSTYRRVKETNRRR